MLILYSLPFSNYSAKVAIALNIKGIDHEKRPPPGGYSSPNTCASSRRVRCRESTTTA